MPHKKEGGVRLLPLHFYAFKEAVSRLAEAFAVFFGVDKAEYRVVIILRL
jgi:hypothetical protein